MNNYMIFIIILIVIITIFFTLFFLIRWDCRKVHMYYRDIIENNTKRYIKSIDGFRLAINDNTQIMFVLKEVIQTRNNIRINNSDEKE